jgi:hypothetical protein
VVVRKGAVALIALLLAISSVYSVADEQRPADNSIRVLSWNISEDAFVSEQREFRSLLRWADPDLILLDEVQPSANTANLIKSFEALRPDVDETWTVDIGVSGGRQRCVVASRAPQESLPEFSSIIPYPDADRRYLLQHMSDDDLDYSMYSMDGGIPVNGAIVLDGDRRLLAIIADLQCCGNDQSSWQEYRRRVEAREIRRLIKQVLQRTSVDGILIAGDLNLVNGPMPLLVLSGPGLRHNTGLIAAELYHPNSSESWTWDGRGTPFPSGTLDFQIYDPQGLNIRSGLILDTENLLPETLDRHRLEGGMSAAVGRHRPLVVEYGWIIDRNMQQTGN